MRTWWLRWLVVLGCLFMLCACAKDEAERRGELMLTIVTDLEPPKDFDEIHVEVLSFGSVQFSNDYAVGESDLRLPSTLGLVVGSEPTEPVTIRVMSSLRGRARSLREVVTTIPRDRVAMLTVKIDWLCLDQVEEQPDGTVTSTCDDGETCVAGACVPWEVDSTTLPDYAATDIFGGGDGSGSGSCFDTVGCFASGYSVEVNPRACSFPAVTAPGPDRGVSVALVLGPGSDGICGPEACLVPLDAGAVGGWVEAGDEIQLPPSVCARLEAGDIWGVAVTTACESKTESLPTCGLWSSVDEQEGTLVGGAPEGIEQPGPAASGGEAGAAGASGTAGTSPITSGAGGVAGVGNVPAAGAGAAAGEEPGSGGSGGVATGATGGEGGSGGTGGVGGSSGVSGSGGVVTGGAAGTAGSGGLGGVGTGGLSGSAGESTGGAAGAAGEPPVPETALVVSSEGNYWQHATPLQVTGATPDVTVDEGTTYQDWEGFGGTFNEVGWDVLVLLSTSERDRALRLLFDAQEGAGFVLGLIPIGATDFAVERYTLCDAPCDATMAGFSIDRDIQYLIPYIQAARAVNPDLRLRAAPWTPPPWMKDNNDYDGGYIRSDPQTLQAYALYLARFVEAYADRGIDVEAIYPQNEPGYTDQYYPCCGWTTEVMTDFIANYLGPSFAVDLPNTDIWLGHLSNPDIGNQIGLGVMANGAAASYVSGIGLQWGMIEHTAEYGPYGLPVWQTQHQGGNFPGAEGGYNPVQAPNDHAYAEESWGLIKQWVETGVNAYLAWNMVTDTVGMSLDSHVPWPQNALLTVDRNARTLIETPAYYVFRHFGAFVEPGAVRIGTAGSLESLAFRNPDGSIATILYNSGDSSAQTTLGVRGTQWQFNVPAHGWATVDWQPGSGAAAAARRAPTAEASPPTR